METMSAGYKSDYELTNDTLYLALEGEIWFVFYEGCEENLLRYKEVRL